jgi:4a-hydroxytetrahydrobiopterin dehydratase
LQGAALTNYLEKVDPQWEICNEKILERSFKFSNFKQALDFTNAVARVAEEQGHHPEITLTWGRVTVRLWTHKIGGLHENDFILAAKIDHIDTVLPL